MVNRRQVHIVRDSEDNKILESAVEAEADFLVTNDNDLLEIGEHEGVKIVNPSQFWVNYQDEEGDDIWKKWAGFIANK